MISSVFPLFSRRYPFGTFRFQHNGRRLHDNEKTLGECNIGSGATLNLYQDHRGAQKVLQIAAAVARRGKKGGAGGAGGKVGKGGKGGKGGSSFSSSSSSPSSGGAAGGGGGGEAGEDDGDDNDDDEEGPASVELKVKSGHGADSNFGVVTCDASDTAEIIEARIRFALASGELDSTIPNLGGGYRHWTLWTSMAATGDGWYSGTPLKPQDVYAIAVVDDTVDVRKEGTRERTRERENERERERHRRERTRERNAGRKVVI